MDNADFLFSAVLLALIFMPLERLRPYDSHQPFLRKHWLSDISYIVINGFLLKIAFGLLVIGLLILAERIVPTRWQSLVQSQPIWLQFFEILILGDLIFYWIHRAFHHFPVLWQFHAVHHSIEDLDWLAGHRVHMVDQLLTKGSTLIPAILLGFSPVALIIWGVVYSLHSVLLHSNVRISFGGLSPFVASPHFHRWHHAAEVDAYDKNFAGQLSVLDRIFGTFHMPHRAPQGYGIEDAMPDNWVGHFLYPIRQWGKSNDQDNHIASVEAPKEPVTAEQA